MINIETLLNVKLRDVIVNKLNVPHQLLDLGGGVIRPATLDGMVDFMRTAPGWITEYSTINVKSTMEMATLSAAMNAYNSPSNCLYSSQFTIVSAPFLSTQRSTLLCDANMLIAMLESHYMLRMLASAVLDPLLGESMVEYELASSEDNSIRYNDRRKLVITLETVAEEKCRGLSPRPCIVGSHNGVEAYLYPGVSSEQDAVLQYVNTMCEAFNAAGYKGSPALRLDVLALHDERTAKEEKPRVAEIATGSIVDDILKESVDKIQEAEDAMFLQMLTGNKVTPPKLTINYNQTGKKR